MAKESFKVGDVVLINGTRSRITSWPDDDNGIFRYEQDIPGHDDATVTGDGYWGTDEEGEPLRRNTHIEKVEGAEPEKSRFQVNYTNQELDDLNVQLDQQRVAGVLPPNTETNETADPAPNDSYTDSTWLSGQAGNNSGKGNADKKGDATIVKHDSFDDPGVATADTKDRDAKKPEAPAEHKAAAAPNLTVEKVTTSREPVNTTQQKDGSLASEQAAVSDTDGPKNDAPKPGPVKH